jgi:hypothetical protein
MYKKRNLTASNLNEFLWADSEAWLYLGIWGQHKVNLHIKTLSQNIFRQARELLSGGNELHNASNPLYPCGSSAIVLNRGENPEDCHFVGLGIKIGKLSYIGKYPSAFAINYSLGILLSRVSSGFSYARLQYGIYGEKNRGNGNCEIYDGQKYLRLSFLGYGIFLYGWGLAMALCVQTSSSLGNLQAYFHYKHCHHDEGHSSSHHLDYRLQR